MTLYFCADSKGRNMEMTKFSKVFLRLSVAVLAATILTATGRSADVIVGIPPLNPDPNQEFQIDVTVDVGTAVLGSYVFNFIYDEAVVEVIQIDGGLSPEFSSAPICDPATFASGSTIFAASQPNRTSPAGFVSIAQLTLRVVGMDAESSNLDILVISLNNGKAEPVAPIALFQSSVLINFDAIADPDNDGHNNQGELVNGTDLMNPDTDGDGMNDGFEVSGGLDPIDPGDVNFDPDDDGHTNLSESVVWSLPNDDHSQPAELILDLLPGAQLVFYPLDLFSGFSAFDLLTELNGGSNAVMEIHSIPDGEIIETAFVGVGPEGDDFILIAGQDGG